MSTKELENPVILGENENSMNAGHSRRILPGKYGVALEKEKAKGPADTGPSGNGRFCSAS